MSDRIKQVPDGDDVRELLQVLTRIFEMVRRLPPGAERIAALEQIRDFQIRLSAILSKRIKKRPDWPSADKYAVRRPLPFVNLQRPFPAQRNYAEFGWGAAAMFDVYLNDRRDLLVVRKGLPIPPADVSGRWRKKKRAVSVSEEISRAVQRQGYYKRKIKSLTREKLRTPGGR